jgi:hypothetical protein
MAPRECGIKEPMRMCDRLRGGPAHQARDFAEGLTLYADPGRIIKHSDTRPAVSLILLTHRFRDQAILPVKKGSPA